MNLRSGKVYPIPSLEREEFVTNNDKMNSFMNEMNSYIDELNIEKCIETMNHPGIIYGFGLENLFERFSKMASNENARKNAMIMACAYWLLNDRYWILMRERFSFLETQRKKADEIERKIFHELIDICDDEEDAEKKIEWYYTVMDIIANYCKTFDKIIVPQMMSCEEDEE